MIIKGNFIYTPSLDQMVIRKNEYLVVEDGKVKTFYKALPPKYQTETVIDHTDALIIPAFNDLHIHAPQYINRGIGFDKELLPWLETYTFPMEAKYKDMDFADRSYRLFLHRLWENGTLRFSAFATLHKEATWHLMELCERSGLKAWIGKVNMDRNSPDYLCEDTSQSLQDTEELIQKVTTLQNVNYIITPRFVPSTTEALMRGLGELVKKYDLPVQSHLSENKSEIAWVKELHPNIPTYTEVYEAFGLMPKGKTIMAHCIHLSEPEKAILKERDVMMCHCAQSNADLSSGIMPLKENLDLGLRCCIASDIAGSHTPDMNRHIALSIELSKIYHMQHPEVKAITLPQALFLATKQSGSFFGKVGSFEAGYAFDALVIETEEMPGFLQREPFEKLEQFIYDGKASNILERDVEGKKIPCPFGQSVIF